MSRRYNPWTEQASALGQLDSMLEDHAAEIARVQEEYSGKWPTEKRKDAEKSGDALPGGRFPIRDQEDLNNAVTLVGNSSLPSSTVKAHIRKQAKKHSLSLPKTWSDSSS